VSARWLRLTRVEQGGRPYEKLVWFFDGHNHVCLLTHESVVSKGPGTGPDQFIHCWELVDDEFGILLDLPGSLQPPYFGNRYRTRTRDGLERFK